MLFHASTCLLILLSPFSLERPGELKNRELKNTNNDSRRHLDPQIIHASLCDTGPYIVRTYHEH
jgi:hypothetical protein